MMKRAVLIMVVLMSGACVWPCIGDDDVRVDSSQLPEKARVYLGVHFPGLAVMVAERDSDGYEAVLANGVKVEFRLDGEWDCVGGGREALPESVTALLPEGCRTYVKTQYPQAVVVQVDRERYGYELELDNGLELKFDVSGTFLGIDD